MTINSQVYQILTGNPKIYDGKTLFVSEHKNLLKEGTGITQEAVQAMILALGGHKKKQDDMEEAIIIRPGTIGSGWAISSLCIPYSTVRLSAHPERSILCSITRIRFRL